MTEPTMGNAEIREDKAAFMAAYQRAQVELGAIPGVVGVGFGHKQVDGVFSDNVCIIVFVRRKRPETDVEPAERIPESYAGYLTDVRNPLAVVPGGCDNETEYSTIQGGIQVQVDPAAVGTLGCIVRRRGDPGRENVYLLSNKHVLWSQSYGEGSYAYHPHTPGGSRASNSLGEVQRAAKYGTVRSTVPGASGSPVQQDFFIDCATAIIHIDSKCCGSTCTRDTTEYAESVVDLQVNSVNTISDVRSIAFDPDIVIPSGPAGPNGPFVYKVGRTTGRTRGIVRSIGATAHIPGDPSDPNAPAQIDGPNVIEIAFDQSSTPDHLNCHGHPFFGEHGDSGSLVVDDAGRAVGLLFGVPDDSTPGVTSSSACHILPVLDFLGICIPTTTGTSHGSSRATDGSGIALSPMGDFEPGDASIRFARGPEPEAVPMLMQVTDNERDHMLGLRERFRATPLGPELHEVFAQVRREVGYHVRNTRRVKIVWHRGEGPAYLAHTLKHLRGESATIPTEVDGISRGELLARMGDVLAAHGSNPLRDAIERYRGLLLPILATAATVDEAIEQLAAVEAADSQVLVPMTGRGQDETP